MANFNRRAALIGAALSSASLLPAISLVRAKEPETVQSLAQRLQAALEQDGATSQVIVTPDGFTINPEPVDPWPQLVEVLDARATGYDGWRLHAGRSIVTGRAWGQVHGVRLIEEEHRGVTMKIERDFELGRIA